MKVERVYAYHDDPILLLRNNKSYLLHSIIATVPLSVKFQIEPVKNKSSLGWFPLAHSDRLSDILRLIEQLARAVAAVVFRRDAGDITGAHRQVLNAAGDLLGLSGDDLERLTRQIYREAGEEFNINSTKQLAEILFVKMKLPVIKRTKTGYSTDVNVLEKLAEDHAFPKLLLEYREKSKLKSTYFDALPEMVNPETRLIHTSFHQTTTATGRLSSSDPNLQNIPIKTKTGREIRKAFVARSKDRSILSADYSQIELRILAHLSEDENLTQAFLEDRDIHTFTATLPANSASVWRIAAR